jgi:hypothetical protein
MLADIHTAKRGSERFAKLVIVKVELHDDVVTVARRLEPHEWTVVAVEPSAHGTESFRKARAGNEYLDDSHSELPIKVLYRPTLGSRSGYENGFVDGRGEICGPPA